MCDCEVSSLNQNTHQIILDLVLSVDFGQPIDLLLKKSLMELSRRLSSTYAAIIRFNQNELDPKPILLKSIPRKLSPNLMGLDPIDLAKTLLNSKEDLFVLSASEVNYYYMRLDPEHVLTFCLKEKLPSELLSMFRPFLKRLSFAIHAHEETKKNHLLRELLDEIPHAIFVLEPESRLITDFNNTFNQLIGRPIDEDRPLYFYDIETRYTRIIKERIELLEGLIYNKKQEWYFRLKHRKGQIIPVRATASRKEFADKSYILFQAVDLSRGSELRHDLRTSLPGQFKKNKLIFLGQMLATIVHDIRSPLTVIQGQTSLLKENFHSLKEEAVNQKLESILRSTTAINAIVTTTLDLAREGQIAIEDIDLKDLIYEVRDYFCRQLEARNISFQIEVPTGHQIKANRTSFLQVFLNLTTNSMDAIQDQEEPVIKVGVQGETIYFSDSGHGIPSEIVDRIFDLNFSTKGKNGNGIGLGHARELLAKQGFDISYSLDHPHTTFLIKGIKKEVASFGKKAS